MMEYMYLNHPRLKDIFGGNKLLDTYVLPKGKGYVSLTDEFGYKVDVDKCNFASNGKYIYFCNENGLYR